jgi:hypothetical protein
MRNSGQGYWLATRNSKNGWELTLRVTRAQWAPLLQLHVFAPRGWQVFDLNTVAGAAVVVVPHNPSTGRHGQAQHRHLRALPVHLHHATWTFTWTRQAVHTAPVRLRRRAGEWEGGGGGETAWPTACNIPPPPPLLLLLLPPACLIRCWLTTAAPLPPPP